MMITSDAGVSFIQKHEGVSLVVYGDSAALDTIGYGHLIKPGEDYLLAGITIEKAAELLLEDVVSAEKCVNTGATQPMTQNEFDALVSFTFNVGCKAFKNSTLLKKFNAGDKNGAACEFMRWCYATVGGVKTVIAGLQSRRKDEQLLFFGGVPDCDAIFVDETPSKIVADAGPVIRKDAPVRGAGVSDNRLPRITIRVMEEVDAILKTTGKLPEKKGYKVQRQGDRNVEGGIISAPAQGTVFVNGKRVSVNNSLVIGSAPKHPSVTANGSKKVFAEGKPVNFETNKDANQLPRIGGSKDTFSR